MINTFFNVIIEVQPSITFALVVSFECGTDKYKIVNNCKVISLPVITQAKLSEAIYTTILITNYTC